MLAFISIPQTEHTEQVLHLALLLGRIKISKIQFSDSLNTPFLLNLSETQIPQSCSDASLVGKQICNKIWDVFCFVHRGPGSEK